VSNVGVREEGRDYSAGVQVLVLGPVTVVDHGESHEVDVPRHRAVLAALALRGGAPVQTSELIDAVWGDAPPPSADKTLQGYVSALRKRFGADIIVTVPGGYRLGEAVDAVDAAEFEELVASGRRLSKSGDLEGARRCLTNALLQWRGEPVIDLAPGALHDGHRARLAELRILAHEGRADAELDLGHHHAIIPDLEQLVAEHPYREPLWRALMLAHYRSGSAGAALDAARRLREVLRDELGITPSAETETLERRILDQDPTLDLVVRPRGNLPVPLDSFVGRVIEQQRVVELVRRHRLVTLLGVGGVGKSRLANEIGRAVAGEHPGGVWWVDLAAMPTKGSVLGHVLAAMELSTAGTPEDVLVARLRGRPALLVLDNCEHARERVAAFVLRVTSLDAGVRILATSRVPIDVRGEQRVPIGPLPVGGPGSDGARLFLDRVSARGEVGAIDAGDVAAIVDAVGGLPLGVELAAAQCGAKTTSEIARRLRDRHALLALSARGDNRHRSLRHVLDATVDALSPELAEMLPRLAVFPGDFGLEAAAATLDVASIDAGSVLVELVDSSLVTAVPGPGNTRRFRLLWPVRELLLERVGPAVAEEAVARCAEHFRVFASTFVDAADGPVEATWLAQARIDDHNLRFALAWWEEHDPLTAIEFGPGLGPAWMIRGDQAEGRDALHRLLAGAVDAPSLLIAATELGLSFLELLSGDAAAGIALGNDAIARFTALDEPRWLGRALRLRAHALHLGGMAAEITDPIYQRSLDLARAAHLTYSQAITEVHFAHAAGANEEFDRAAHLLSHAEAVLRRHGDHGQLAHAGLGRAFVAFGRRDADACRRAGEGMLRQAQLAMDTIWEQIASVVLGLSWHELGDTARSRRFFRDAVHLAHDTANTEQLGIALHALAATVAGSDAEAAARLWGAAGGLTPIWPLHARRYGEWMASARDALGDRFDAEVATGAGLSVDDAVALADTLI
jgi:DNA-binding SARP family transcriptional activator/predicted ATPase